MLAILETPVFSRFFYENADFLVFLTFSKISSEKFSYRT